MRKIVNPPCRAPELEAQGPGEASWPVAEFISTGYGSFVSSTRLMAIVLPDAAPIRRLVQEARDRGALIDATAGRKTRSVLIMDSDQVILSALAPEKLLSGED